MAQRLLPCVFYPATNESKETSHACALFPLNWTHHEQNSKKSFDKTETAEPSLRSSRKKEVGKNQTSGSLSRTTNTTSRSALVPKTLILAPLSMAVILIFSFERRLSTLIILRQTNISDT